MNKIHTTDYKQPVKIRQGAVFLIKQIDCFFIIINQYIDRMITQSSEHEAINTFYRDILIFDDPLSGIFSSKELYLKRNEKFFTELPEKFTARELIHSIYKASTSENKQVLLGYFRNQKHTLFAGEKMDMEIQIKPSDRLIFCSDH